MREVQLIGLDFGTTTSNAVVATADLATSAVTGRMELARIVERYRSEMVFTPLQDDGRLDEWQIDRLVDSWLAAGRVRPEELFGGGALLTGLAAQSDNARDLVRLVRRRLGDSLIATADDPCLESWLAFMGSSAGLSRAIPHQPVLNLDIGGGTTNLAIGKNGEVLRTGCLWVGARHVQVLPGSYHIVRLSVYAQALFDHLGIGKGPGDLLTEAEVLAVLDFYLRLLEAAVTRGTETFQEPVARLHQRFPFHLPTEAAEEPAVTFSGGVGELIYGYAQGKAWPPTTCYGDLGIDLARRIAESLRWAGHIARHRPSTAGRATVYGLLRHSTAVSGSTLFLPRPEVLPLPDVPILGSLDLQTPDDQLRTLVDLVRRSGRGGCLQVCVGSHDAAAVRVLGTKIAAALRQCSFPAHLPLVLLVRENLGKVLGHYVTAWGALAVNLIVVDEVAVRDAQYVHLGGARSQVVPVSFFGLNEQGDSP